MKKPTVVLADDHKIVLEGLKSLLEDDFELLGTVDNGRDLLDLAEKLRPDIIVADITMPQLNGIDAVLKLKKNKIRSKVILLTMHKDVTYAARAFEAGASGFVLKHSASHELISAIRAVLKGRTYITPHMAEDLMKIYKKGDHKKKDELSQLSSRHREILQLLAEGKSAKEAAVILKISSRTVEFHKYDMMKKLGIKTTAALIQFAIKQGLMSL